MPPRAKRAAAPPEPKLDTAGRKVDDDGLPLGGAGAAQVPHPEVQAAADEATAKGYRGEGVDPTPNDNYTVAGVLAGSPTPETDDDAAAVARRASERKPR